MSEISEDSRVLNKAYRFVWKDRSIISRLGMGCGGTLIAAAIAFWFLAWPRATLRPSWRGVASLQLAGIHSRLVSAEVTWSDHRAFLVDHSTRLTPTSKVPVGTEVRVAVELRRPSWIAWLAGRTVELSEQVRTPAARLLDTVVLAHPGQAVFATFNVPVSEVSIKAGNNDPLERLATPSKQVKVISQVNNGEAGIVQVAASPLPWETLPAPEPLTYFGVKGHALMAIFTPSITTTPVGVSSPLDITLSEPVSKAFGQQMPTIEPVVQGALVPKGTWSEPTPYNLLFTPSGPDFWPGEQMQLTLPTAVSITTGQGGATKPTRTIDFEGEPGSTLRLQQMLASLHYLPLRWSPQVYIKGYSKMSTQLALMTTPPQGSFTWRYSFPVALSSLWSPGSYTVMTKGAVMAFEQVEGLATVGRSNPLLWPTLVKAVLNDQVDPHPYSWIQVSMQLPERLWLYLNGKVVLTSLANTGIPQAPTAPGTYPIYLRFKFNYMSGFNPNGTYYHDPVYWINYFNGGDAVHGFVRASYGFPQSLGCVELPVAVAAQVYPQVHIGTLVTVMP